jgi:hypothetical protein
MRASVAVYVTAVEAMKQQSSVKVHAMDDE